MNTLTKDQMQQFTPEQQDAVATLAMRRVQKRERLLKHARQSRYYSLATAALMAIPYAVAVYQKVLPLLLLGFMGIGMAILVQSIAINRRLEAMLELFEDDDQDAV